MQRLHVNAEEQQKLLRWARQTIEAAVRNQARVPIPEAELTGALRSPHGAFVTLKKRNELRGCIGKMDFERPVWENVMGAAIASALNDPRFPSMDPGELPEVRLEISILQPPIPLARIQDFDAQRHGIIIQKGVRHGLLLPKVAQEYGWDAQKTLEMVCWKAGLPPQAWREPDAQLQVFEAFDFAEPVG